jgi:hypothetical protein
MGSSALVQTTKLIVTAAPDELKATTTFREQLPPGCPPSDSKPTAGQMVWRLFPKNPVSSDCFDSQSVKFPSQTFNDDCIARAVSVFETKQQCRDALKFPRLKRASRYVGQLVLQVGSGVVKETGRKGHLSWWIYASVDPSTYVVNMEALP